MTITWRDRIDFTTLLYTAKKAQFCFYQKMHSNISYEKEALKTGLIWLLFSVDLFERYR